MGGELKWLRKTQGHYAEIRLRLDKLQADVKTAKEKTKGLLFK
jgi:hypothetical protein